MDILLKVLAYLLAGLGLLTINLWFARAAYNAFVGNPPLVIAPFQIIGKDDAGGKIGATLAGMLLARLSRITQEMDASTRSLQAARERRGQAQIQTLDLPDPAPLSVSERLFAPLDLKMTVGGVEVGGLISWIHGKLSRDSLLQISIQYDGDRVIAVSHAAGDVDHSLWIETKGGNDETVAAIAYALTHRQFARRVPEVEALTPAEFRSLLSTIHRAAELDRQVAHGRSASKAYAELLPNLEALLDKAPRWSALLGLTAELAENAGEPAKARTLYRKEMEGQDGSDARRADVAARIERLSQLIAATTPTPGAAAAVPGPAAALTADRVGFPLTLLGVTSREMRGTPPLIAVVGGIPPAGTLPADRFTVVGDSPSQSGAAAGTADGDDMMTEYTLTVVQTVELVAPKARFVFAPVRSSRGTSTSADILRAMNLAVGARPNILLVTLGPLEGAIFEQALQHFVDAGVLVVLAAGNQPERPVPLAGSPVFKTLMAVAASDAEGGPAKFTQRGTDVFWAPGEKIPVQPRAGKTEARAGTTYAAALAAGVAARVLAEHPKLGVPRLIDTLRETAVPVKPGGPKLLNLDKALARLSG